MKRLLSQLGLLTMSVLISAATINAQPDVSTSPESKPSVGVLSEEVVRARLSSAGYAEIHSIKREEQHYLIETVRNGRPVRVKLDAVTGRISEEAR